MADATRKAKDMLHKDSFLKVVFDDQGKPLYLLDR
jgi:hypothetical protein